MKKLTYTLGLLLLSMILSSNLLAKGSARQKMPMPESSLLFIENKGQIKGQDAISRDDIQYKIAANAGMNIFIGKGTIHYQWAKQGSETEMYRLDVMLLGANMNAAIEQEDKQAYFEKYYLDKSPDGITVNAYNKIIYKNIYKNIDWVLYTKGNRLEYDFIVHPGGNTKDIQIKYDGASKLSLNDGSVTATTPFGSITEQKPYSYLMATNKEITSAFVLKNNIMGFNVAKAKGTVVIDPNLSWATYYGGDSLEHVYDVASDTAGNVYLFGSTTSTNYIATSGAYQINLDSNADAFLVKFNSLGVRQWATYYGGKGDDLFKSASCDMNGNIYIGGATSSTNNIAVAGFQSTPGPGFFMKVTSLGQRLWSSFFNGIIDGITYDNSGSIYLIGSTTSKQGIATPGSHQDTLAGSDGFIVKFDTLGKRHWGTYYGGNSFVTIDGVCTDATGNVYVCGITNSDIGIATKGSYLDTFYFKLVDHGFLVKFNSYGQRIWGTYYGDTNSTQLNAAICDGEGNVYAGGMGQLHVPVNSDGLLVKFNGQGQRLWETFYGNTGEDIFHDLAVNNAGYVYAMGSTTSSNGIATTDGYKTTFGGSIDAFIAQFKYDGQRKWATYYGGTNIDVGNGYADKGLSYSAKGKLYLSSSTGSTSAIATVGSFKDTINGISDAYIAQFSETDTTVYIAKPNNYITICQGIILFNVNYNVTRNFNAGNTFTVQLSDATGNFASGANIGSNVSNTSGVINCSVPFLAPASSNYRLRIISSSPVDTSEAYRVNIYPTVSPYIHIAVSLNDTVCKNDTLVFYADTTIDGGLNPIYQWRKNGADIVGATTATYVSSLLQDNDTISCYLISNHPCVHTNVASNKIVLSINSVMPTAKLVATPSSTVTIGSTIVFSAILTNAGSNPSYQWKKNGQYIPGATHDTLMFKNGFVGDRISLKVTSSAFCAQPDTALTDTMTVIYTGSIAYINTGNRLSLYPNPNNGSFVLHGNISASALEIEVLNTLGQIIYTKHIKSIAKELNEPVTLPNVPAGIYTLRATSGDLVENIRFTVD